MKSNKFLFAAAALSGLMAGSSARASAIVSSPTQRVHIGTAVIGVKVINLDDKEAGKHGCKGQNSCKGQGGCKSGDNGCKGKNSCKGQGGCKTISASASTNRR